MRQERKSPHPTPSEEQLTAPFGDLQIQTLAPPMRKLVKALLLYKSMFAGAWFDALSSEEDAETQTTYTRISNETKEQAKQAADLLRRWDDMAEHEKMEDVTNQVLKRLLDDMLSLKKSSTEVFLSAGISAPTEEMRREFLDLADIDRRHADDLRAALGVHLPRDVVQGRHVKKGYAGVHAGPFPPGTITATITAALDAAKAAGQEPARIAMSSMTLRHLRDEGSVEPSQGDVFGVPVDIDFSWDDEAFSIASRARVSLAEIVTEMEAGAIKGALGSRAVK